MADEAAHHEEAGETCGEKSDAGRDKPSRGRLLAELKDLRESLEKERKRSEEYLVQIKYLQADFDNYSKRLKKELEEQVKRGSERLIIKLLPILDDLERAVEVSEGEEDNPLQDGVKMILKRLKDTLSEEGLSEIEALGKSFDPLRHEAVRGVETSEHPEGVVLKVLRKGYVFNGRVLRPSLVEVSTPIQPSSQNHKIDEDVRGEPI
jgi:molecular chaperone GrpE